MASLSWGALQRCTHPALHTLQKTSSEALRGRVSDGWSPALVGVTEFGTRVGTRWTRSSLSEGAQLSGGDMNRLGPLARAVLSQKGLLAVSWAHLAPPGLWERVC